MHILITNDDGINAPGIKALWEQLAALGQITVVAPDTERSATSQAITVHHPIRVDRHYIDTPEICAWRVGGTPTDCVKLAIETLLTSPPDFVISGVNQGANLGTDVLYSGTVSAAIEGAIHNIPSVAISLDSWNSSDFSVAASFAEKLITTMRVQSLPPNTLLNVNIPALPKNEISGTAITKLGIRLYENTFEKRIDPRGRIYYWMGGKIAEYKNDPDSDIVALEMQKISVTPIHFDLTNYKIMELLQNWQL